MAYVDTLFLNTTVTSLKTMFCRNHGKRLVVQLWCCTCQVLPYCEECNLKTLFFMSFLKGLLLPSISCIYFGYCYTVSLNMVCIFSHFG